MSSVALQYAILSLDSYNQGYDPFVDHGKIVIGSMTKILESDISANSDEVAASFYAAAYQDASGNIVISYRGTDAPIDVVTGWTGGAGFRTRQAELAAQFYHQVKQAYPDATITLTGHSLGGGLAGWPGARRVPVPKIAAGCGVNPG